MPARGWLQLNREGILVARCTVERLMRDLGLEGARCGRRYRTTSAAPAASRAPGLVLRRFTPDRPDRLWLVDLVCQEAFSNRVEVRDLRRWAVAAVR